MMKRIYKIGLFLLLVVGVLLPHAYLPVVQTQIHGLQAKKLGGDFEAAPKPRFWLRKWLTKEFQQAHEKHIWQESSIAPFFVRLRTQLGIKLHQQFPQDNLVKGKGSQIFTYNSCEAYIGHDFIGRKAIRELCDKLEKIQTHFAKDSIPFLLLLPPNKVRMYPELLPNFYQQVRKDTTNQQVFLQELKQRTIPFIDFSYFIDLQATIEYPLYPHNGLHWSHYGLGLAADSIRNRVENMLSRPLPKFIWKTPIEWSDQLSSTDRELINGGNFFTEPHKAPMPYPNYRYQKEDSSPPNILAIGDSYYKLILDQGIHNGLWSDQSEFWYYFNTIFPEYRRHGQTPRSVDLLERVRDRDMVIITCYDTNLDKFGFGFIEKMYDRINSTKQ